MMNFKPTRISSRRCFIRRATMLSAAVTLPSLLVACADTKPSFKSTDITGADFAKQLRLQDQNGTARSLADFNGKIVVVFFGYTQCPDVCPTSLSTLAEVKGLLGDQGQRLQVVFITVDPERDTLPLLKEYVASFGSDVIALRPSPEELQAVAAEFKVHYSRVDGSTTTSYTMDHSAGKYIFDPQGRVRLFSPYGTDAETIAADVRTLLKGA